jgi:hypothetical protein
MDVKAKGKMKKMALIFPFAFSPFSLFSALGVLGALAVFLWSIWDKIDKLHLGARIPFAKGGRA